MTRLRSALPVIFAVGLAGVFLAAVTSGALAPDVETAIDDLGQLIAAAVASVFCFVRPRSRHVGTVRSWRLLGTGAAAWALGEGVWTYYEVVAGRATPFPSLADLGFLLFPVFAAAGLLLWPSAARHRATRWRALLDGGLIAGALLIVSWATALGPAFRAAADGWFAFVVSLAYPVSDLMLLTLTLVIVTHRYTRSRSGLLTLSLGVGCLCVADTAFAYLTATGVYGSGSVADTGWVAGFLLMAAAARSASRPGSVARPDISVESTATALVPYVPAIPGLAVATWYELKDGTDAFIVLSATIVVVILLTRQLIALLDNRRLAERLVDAQANLEFLAFHDPLTGLANRALFSERLDQALAERRRDPQPLSLMYCDLDDFKGVNDSLGHEVGDDMLRAFAERLRAATRPADTVSRMGGDEFVILLEAGGDPALVAARILGRLEDPVQVGEERITLRASIGIVELSPSDPDPDPDRFVQAADTAMYTAKRQGKGTVAFASRPAVAPPLA